MLKHSRKYVVPELASVIVKKSFRDKWIDRSPLNEKTNKLDFGWVPLFTLSVTLFTAVLFGAGKAYRKNYLAVFEFTDWVVPWSFQDVVYLGVIKQLPILLAAPIGAIGGVVGFVLLIVFLSWITTRLGIRRAKKIRNSKTIKADSNDDSLIAILEFGMNYLVPFLFFVWISAFFVAHAEKLGKSDAQSEMDRLTQKNKGKSSLNYVTIERLIEGKQIVESGYLVSCSEHMCGLYMHSKEKNESKLVPLSGVTSFVTKADALNIQSPPIPQQ